MRRSFALFSLSLLGCDDAPKQAAAPAPPKAAELRALVTPEEAEAVLSRWQGAWVMPFRTGPYEDSPIGLHEVWAIEGDALTRWDGTAEQKAKLTVLAPCMLKVDWGEHYVHTDFVFVGDALHVQSGVGIGHHGSDRTIACFGETAYTIDDGLCREWRRPMIASGDALRAKDAKCSLVGEAGSRRFEVAASDDRSPRSLRLTGDLLHAHETPPKPAQRFATMAEAQASLR